MKKIIYGLAIVAAIAYLVVAYYFLFYGIYLIIVWVSPEVFFSAVGTLVVVGGILISDDNQQVILIVFREN